MSNILRVLIIALLCIAVVFVSGILLPKYLSSQVFEFQRELKSQDGNSKYSLQANLVPVAEKYTRDERRGFMSNRNVKTAEVFQKVSASNSTKSPVKVKKRSKRQAMSKDKHYTLNFHLNLTQQQNALKETVEIASDTIPKHKLGMSIYAEGNGKHASTDIQLALGLAEYYFKELFKRMENQTEDTHELAHSENIKIDFSTLDAAGRGDESIRGREGKILILNSLNLFNIWNFKKNIAPSDVLTISETNSVFLKDDIVRTTQSPQTNIFTENLQEVPTLSSFKAQPHVSETLNLVSNTSGSTLPEKTEEGKCMDCATVGLDSSLTSSAENFTKNNAPETVISSTQFADESFEMLCKRLVNKVGVPQHLSDTENIIVDPKQNNLNDHILKSSDNLDLGSLPSSDSEKELNLAFSSVNFLVSSDIPENKLREKKVLSFGNLFPAFGSGRSDVDQDESNELTSEVFSNVGNLPQTTLLDCENYFRKRTKLLEANEFGSGDLNTLKATSFGTRRNEFGSNNLGSLEVQRNDFERDLKPFESEGFSTDKNEFGSGDSFKETFTGLFKSLRSISSNKERFSGDSGLIGSGDGRDLSGNLEEKCQSNCSFEVTTEQPYDCDDYECNYETFNESDNSFDDNDLENKGCHENCLNVSSVDTRNEHGKTEANLIILEQIQIENFTAENFQRSFSFNESFKDDGFLPTLQKNESETLYESVQDNNRDNLEDLVEMNKIATEENKAFSKCGECTECNNSEECNSSISHISDELEEIFPAEELVVIGINETRVNKNLETSSNTTNVNVDEHTDKGSIDSSKAQNAIKSLHEQSTENIQRILGSILLAGSGDGGLLDSGGTMNLIQEDSKSPNVSFRHSRLDDIPFNFSEVPRETSLEQWIQESPVNGNTVTEKFISPVSPIKRRGRMDDYADFTENYLKNKKSDGDFNKTDNFNSEERQADRKMPITIKNKITTVSSDLIRGNDPLFGDINNEFKFQPHPCIAARECNVTLNERCITINSSRVCGCSRGYARNMETKKCIVKKVVETSIKLPAENFEDDLKNPLSPSFQQKKKYSVQMMNLIVKYDSELERVLSEIEIAKFSPGSLVITLNLVFAAENKSEAQLVKHVEDNIQIALSDEKLMNSVSLNISEASLLSVNGEIDYCKFSELNYCSEHANCVTNAAIPGNYACHCKEHYRDVSVDPRHMGETCLAKCPREYCGPYGHCELLANDQRLCLCSGLYFGRRCEVPGLYVLIVLAFVGFVSITMLLLVVFKKRCSKVSYGQTQARESEEIEVHSYVNCRVSDAIALEENVGTKFVNISTPKPAITITRPTVTESESSYAFDSTFDSTQSAQKTENSPA